MLNEESSLNSYQNNRFLTALAPGPRERILKLCSLRSLPVGTLLYGAGERTRYCYFPLSGIASVVSATADGGVAEVMLTGREGVTGCIQMLGPAIVTTSCIIQLSATALRMRFPDLLSIFHECAETRARLLEFAQHQTFTVSEIAGCNLLHGAEGRLARWLLMAHDRTGSFRLPFTQVFLAQMLGLERTTVGSIVASLQKSGSIESKRGHLTILDRDSLEANACSCYETAKKLFSGLYGLPWNYQSRPVRRVSPA